MKPDPTIVEAEVVAETPAAARSLNASQSAADHGGGEKPVVGASIHPLAAILLIGVDNLWNLADWAVVSWIATIPLSFLSVFLPTYFLQRRQQGQSRRRALAWALLFGAVAAIPFSVGGTTVGAAALAWLGINKLSGIKPRA